MLLQAWIKDRIREILEWTNSFDTRLVEMHKDLKDIKAAVGVTTQMSMADRMAKARAAKVAKNK